MRSERSRISSDLLARHDSWNLIAYLVITLSLVIFWLLARSFDRTGPGANIASAITSAKPVASGPLRSTVEAWSMLLADLCSDADLLSRKIRIDCETGSLSIQDEMLFESDGSTLHEEGERLLREAVPLYLDKLRNDPVIWRLIDRIEVRGHADSYAMRLPYQTNLVASQRRALSVVSFLTSNTHLNDLDRDDMRRLSIVSGASFSRPPSDCPSRESRCRQNWRRVEIRVGLDPARLRAHMQGTQTPG